MFGNLFFILPRYSAASEEKKKIRTLFTSSLIVLPFLASKWWMREEGGGDRQHQTRAWPERGATQFPCPLRMAQVKDFTLRKVSEWGRCATRRTLGFGEYRKVPATTVLKVSLDRAPILLSSPPHCVTSPVALKECSRGKCHPGLRRKRHVRPSSPSS